MPWGREHRPHSDHEGKKKMSPEEPMEIEAAIRECAAARARFESARPCTKAWRRAEEELSWWQSKKAFLSAAVAHEEKNQCPR